MNNLEQAKHLIAARRSTVALDAFPGAPPTDLASAYAIQDRMRALWSSQPPDGWKVGMLPEMVPVEGSSARFVGPFWNPTPDGGTVQVPPGDIFAEAEFVVQLARGSSDGSDDEHPLRITRIRLGLEIAGSGVRALSRYATYGAIADMGNNASIVLGNEVTAREMTSLPVSLYIDGNHMRTGGASQIEGGVTAALHHATTILRRRAVHFGPDTWFATGALAGAHRVFAGQRVVATMGAHMVSCSLVGYPAAVS